MHPAQEAGHCIQALLGHKVRNLCQLWPVVNVSVDDTGLHQAISHISAHMHKPAGDLCKPSHVIVRSASDVHLLAFYRSDKHNKGWVQEGMCQMTG